MLAKDPPPSAEALARVHQALVQAWVLAPSSLPAGLEVHGTVRELHRRRAELGHPPDLFLRLELEAAWELSARGRCADGVAYLTPLLEHYVEPSSEVVFLHVFLAGFHRVLEQYGAGLARLAEAERVLAALPADEPPGRAREARIRLFAERSYAWIDRGLPDLAAEDAARCAALAREAWAEGGEDAAALFYEGLFVRLAQLLGTDRPTAALRLLAAPEAEACLADERYPRKRRRARLREAMALANLEHAEPSRPRRALELLRALASELEALGEAAPDAAHERAELWSWLASCAAEEGALEEAEAALERCARVGPGSPRARATVAALRARLAVLGGSAPSSGAALRRAREGCAEAFEALVAACSARPPLATGEGYLLLETFNDLVTEYLAVLLALDEEGRGAERAVEELLRLQAVQSLAKSLAAPQVSLTELPRTLPEEGGALLVQTGWRTSFVFALEREEVRAFPLPPYAALAAARDGLLEALEGARFGTDPRFGPAEVAARAEELAALFLPAELREVLAGWRACTVVGLDSLGYVPLELLPWDDSTSLGERLALAYLPSFPVGEALRARGEDHATSEPLPPTLLVPFPAAGDDGSLVFGPHERALLARDWPDGPRRVLAGDEARLGSLRELRGPWLLVAHGERDASPRPQGIRLADGVLTPAAAEELAAPSLVALLACNTWRGPWRRGDDGRGHLVGSLFLAGARVQLASHARLDYHAGLRLAGWVLAELQRGVSPAEAARRARLRARETLAIPEERWTASLWHVIGLGH